MNMLRIATVEDDAHDLEALRTHLNRYEKELRNFGMEKTS